MKALKRIVFFLLASLDILCAVSCEKMFHYKDLCYDHSHLIDVQILFDWSNCPGADVSQMSIYIYNLDYPEFPPERYDFPGHEGGSLNLQYGNYKILALNSDTDAILYRSMMKSETFEAYSRESSLSEGLGLPEDGTEGSPYLLEPNMLWGGMYYDLSLDISDGTRHVTIPMEPRTIHVTVHMNNVSSLKYFSEIGGTISGTSSSVWMESGEKSGEGSYQTWFAHKTGDQSLSAAFVIYDHCSDDIPHSLTLYTMLEDGTRWGYSIDITSRMNDPNSMIDNSHMVIEIDENIPIPRPIKNGGGLNPYVGGWDTEYIDIGM